MKAVSSQSPLDKKQADSDSITISEDFRFVTAKAFDKKFRVNLGQGVFNLLKKLFPFSSFNVYVSGEGDVLLRPTNVIPSRELWTGKDSAAKASFNRALVQAAEGRTKPAVDLDEFLDEL